MRTDVGGREQFWQRTLRGWDTAFWILLAITAAFTVPAASGPGRRAVTVAAFAALAVGYQLLGHRGARLASRALTQSYLVVLVVATTVVTWSAELGIVLLFVAYSQIWFFATSRVAGVLWTVLLTTGVVAATALRVDASPDELPGIVGQSVVGLVFAIGLGLWVTYVAEEGEVRAQLLDELNAAQAALAASHHSEGVLAERARIAQEIHDTLAQGFTSVVMLAQASSAELAVGRTESAQERIGQIEAVARENLAEARALVAAFAPPALEDGDLAAALRRLGERFAAETGTPVRVDVDAPDTADPVPQDVAVAVLRGAQESLANVRRHAGASSVHLRLTRRSDEVELAVVDDGRGLRPDDPEGNGVRGLRERARAGGGSLELTGSDGAGTRVRLRLPTGGRA
ncbi:sensor histidine kinase [Cellulomonas fulva]|uniref:sensor histidine kinase n=1 Tax=Cellulomonas fulva TaxID=2835530 RepID=UPI0027DB08AC|nr:sensor histidine kinase [Cellulomonas fulva]